MRVLIIVISTLYGSACFAESTCFGTTKDGSLEQGVKLPASGPNFESYSALARLLGRTYVHSEVSEIMVETFKTLNETHPDKVFKYAETGLEGGGKFRPHKTHQNGLSVDMMVPVLDADGNSAHLPTNIFNKLGYNIEFDEFGRFDGFVIDFEAMAAHIATLHKVSVKRSRDLWRVIFDPKLRPFLFETQNGSYLRKNVNFSKKRSWVRHDEHYHIDFLVPCSAKN